MSLKFNLNPPKNKKKQQSSFIGGLFKILFSFIFKIIEKVIIYVIVVIILFLLIRYFFPEIIGYLI